MPAPAVTPAWRRALPGGATVACTGRAEGDFAAEDAEGRQCTLVDLPWSRPVQVHGATVVVVEHPGQGCGVEADALVSRRDDVALAVLTADCAPIGLSSPEGVIGVAHAGWRGLVAGVVEATVASMRDLGATTVHAVVGPAIHAECYEFSPPDLDAAVAAAGADLRGRDRAGRPAMDLPAGVAAALRRAGATLGAVSEVCTACSSDHWSWRARGDRARQATVVWRAMTSATPMGGVS